MSLDQMEIMKNSQKASLESVKKSDDKVSTLMESKNSNAGVSLCPVTPCLTKENVKLTSVSKMDDHGVDRSTPVKDVLDVLDTPGSGSGSGLKQMNCSDSSTARKLDFGCNECFLGNETENGLLVEETMYDSVLEEIIFDQAEDVLTEVLASDEVGTPPSVARLSGLAKTCPGAPLKPKQDGKFKDVKMSLCRRLDFDSYV